MTTIVIVSVFRKKNIRNILFFYTTISNIFKINRLRKKHLILEGGEDYELLFTLDVEDVTKLIESFVQAGRSVTPIGEIAEGPGVELIDSSGRRSFFQKSGGFSHF